jgi:hypothetical protein
MKAVRCIVDRAFVFAQPTALLETAKALSIDRCIQNTHSHFSSNSSARKERVRSSATARFSSSYAALLADLSKVRNLETINDALAEAMELDRANARRTLYNTLVPKMLPPHESNVSSTLEESFLNKFSVWPTNCFRAFVL